MPTAEEIKAQATRASQAAQATQVKENKPLPAMAQPTVSLIEALRVPSAQRARDTGESFSTLVQLLLITKYAEEKRIDATQVEKYTVEVKASKRAGGATAKAKLEAKDQQITQLTDAVNQLKTQLAKLQK